METGPGECFGETGLFQEDEENSQYKAEESSDMVPLQPFSLEHKRDDESEYGQRYDFLNDFQLHKGERSSVFHESDTVCRHLGAILEKGDCP